MGQGHISWPLMGLAFPGCQDLHSILTSSDFLHVSSSAFHSGLSFLFISSTWGFPFLCFEFSFTLLYFILCLSYEVGGRCTLIFLVPIPGNPDILFITNFPLTNVYYSPLKQTHFDRENRRTRDSQTLLVVFQEKL